MSIQTSMVDQLKKELEEKDKALESHRDLVKSLRLQHGLQEQQIKTLQNELDRAKEEIKNARKEWPEKQIEDLKVALEETQK